MEHHMLTHHSVTVDQIWQDSGICGGSVAAYVVFRSGESMFLFLLQN